MVTNTDDIEVRNNAAEQRFEARIGDEIAEIKYQFMDGAIVFTHTEVPEDLEGHGIAAKMAHTALEDAKARHLAVIPFCPYVASYIKRHPEYVPLVQPAYRSLVE